ncbi:Flp family type IVb pilin [Paraburkholderia sp. J41]|uniref:Flp family type IVb pilin n=1 Tax=Paraburkholderia sp. J41 TaxID=2805433 RepID=UPI002AC32E74|nr:Flp family type IVb pilin [Paraburkholderia sp. J41]
MKKIFLHFVKSEDGVTALEYGLIAGVIALAIGSTVVTLGSNLTNVFSSISSTVSQTIPAKAATPAN